MAFLLKFRLLTIILLTIITTNILYANTLNIAVAANVSYAINDLKKEFELQNKNIKLNIILGGSGKLTAKINNNAPYDIFLSANMLYPNSLYKSGYGITKPKVYAKGAIALLTSRGKNLNKGIKSILAKDINKIAIANPKTAPYGKATVEALKNAKLYDLVKAKFVYGESISQTVMYATKMADLGFIAKSALYSPLMSHYKKGISWIDLDPKLYTPIKQGIVILKEGKGSSDVRSFYDFLLSESAKEIFKKFGYILP
jgi:molybdate transport system substrate-binding protein